MGLSYMEHSYITLFNPRECQVCVLCIYTHTQMLKVTDMFLDTYYISEFILSSVWGVQCASMVEFLPMTVSSLCIPRYSTE